MSTCGNNETATITNNAQALALSTCTTYFGSIDIGERFRGDLTLNGIEAITGSLSATRVLGLISLSAESLRTVGGAVQINGSELTTLSLPALQVVKGQIGIWSTPLKNLELPLLNTTEAVFIENNADLIDVKIPKLKRADEIAIEHSGHGGLTLDLSSLQWATHLLINQCSSVDLSSLRAAGDATFYSNTFTTLSLPAFTQALGGLTIERNPNLTSISAPSLTTIELPGDATYQNALTIFANPALTGTIEFPAVVEIKHNADIDGTFSDFSLPALTTFNGNLTIESTENIASTCAFFNDISHVHSTIEFDDIKCLHPSSHDSSSRLKTIIGSVGGAVGVCVVLGLLYVIITFRKVRAKRGSGGARGGAVLRGDEGVELPNYGSLARTEG